MEERLLDIQNSPYQTLHSGAGNKDQQEARPQRKTTNDRISTGLLAHCFLYYCTLL